MKNEKILKNSRLIKMEFLSSENFIFDIDFQMTK